MPDIILNVFAVNGDKSIPAQTDPNGFVNFDQGYTPFYELNLASGNPQAKAVERGVQNYLFNLLTDNTSAWQKQGFPVWYPNMPGGYAQNSFVMRNGKPYRSKVAGNADDPASTPATWEYVPTAAENLTNVPMPSGGSSGPSGLLIVAATDFNSLATGTYEYATDAVAAGSGNTPSQVAGLLETIVWASGPSSVTVQRYTDRSGTVFTRGAAGAAWTNWTQLAAVLSPAFAGTPTAPTPPQFDTSLRIANMAALQRALGNFRGIVNVAATVTITSAQVGNVFKINANGLTVTLPTAIGNAGNAISILSLVTGTTAISANATESINFGNANPVTAPSQSIPGFGAVTLVSDGATWTAISQGGAFLNQAGYKPGTLIMWPATDVPNWSLVRNGSAVSRAVYASLFAILCPVRAATTQNANPNITGMASTREMYVGMPIEGATIPPGTTITAITNATSAVMSASATGAGTSIQLFTYGYGSGGGATTFGLPDDRGIYERGLDQGRLYEGTAYSGTSVQGSPTIQNLSSTRGMFIGQQLTGDNVGAGTTIIGILSATAVTLSSNVLTAIGVTNLNVFGGIIGNERLDSLASHDHSIRSSDTPGGNRFSSGSNSNLANTPGVVLPSGGVETRPKSRSYLPLIAY